MILVAWQTLALALQVGAVLLALRGQDGLAEVISVGGFAIAFASALWVLTRPVLTRAARNTAVVCLGITPALMWHSTNLLMFTGFDEQLHMRTLGDIISSHRLFEANPLLGVSPQYPGLEAFAVLLHQIGLPTMAAATTVVVVCRLMLVTVLCDAVEQLTGDARAGGLAVAAYAVSPQFVFFNSQFAYQTMALPLALAAVSLLARARSSDYPVRLFLGVTVCLFGVAVTHHVTSFLTTVFLVLWALVETGQSRLRILYGALVAVAATLAWAMVQWSMLSGYFGPIIDDVSNQLSTGMRRKPFQDSGGSVLPSWERLLLLYYALMLTLAVLALAVYAFSWWGRHIFGPREHRPRRWLPSLLLLFLVVLLPVLMAARVVPKGGEIFDRSSSFLFLPFSLLVGHYAVRFWWHEPRHAPTAARWRSGTARITAIVLASLMFVGGYILGSGATWSRLPGEYLVSADSRSMDSETLAAVEWARQNLPPGSRMSADRVNETLFAARAGLWPILKRRDADVPSLYFADDWGEKETETARILQLRYLYVDRRWAEQLPHLGSYFFKGETPEVQQLTDWELTKFDTVPGITLLYRHGPTSLYDLKGLGVQELRNGWYGQTPTVTVVTQLAVGLLGGLLIGLTLHSGLRPRLGALARGWYSDAGPALSFATIVAGLTLFSIALLLLGIWLTPMSVGVAVGLVVLINPGRTLAFVRAGWSRMPWRQVGPAALLAVPIAGVLGVAVFSAADRDSFQVRDILDDPSAIHVSPDSTEAPK
ncbi:hypothetical protein MANY_45220 [Mycolicibacterium anyangense]|uniref:Uncharacterized protein n=1 Tax=Mycolicibacterium anyangense TaxID=1431246 RepID=A0A6N4WEF4_9MYCO|nr:hypothetical protein [Mycolicibacterium anyangense]BBZ79185.1 hypothetical protein MANY_45220 [Mycolicibacterium anyangense]